MNLKKCKKDWLSQRAKSIETKILSQENKSPSWITILQRLKMCIIETESLYDVIDYDKYQDIRKRILNKQTELWW